MARERCAVVIGVNKVGDGFASLDSAADGAEEVGRWLTGEGFHVEIFTDHAGKVAVEPIRDAIRAIVDSGTCRQLVIYFSGHGLWKNGAELWLFTDAPGEADAGVNLTETIEMAKDSGIPNIALISDACRSLPATVPQSRMRGGVIFPNMAGGPRSTVDKFAATATGRAAYEIPMHADGGKESVFTHCFLSAYRAPDADMIRKIVVDGATIDVVPNRRLKTYLQRETCGLLARVNITLEQTPDPEVLSDDDVYIGRVRIDPELTAKSTGDEARAAKVQTPQLRDIAAAALDEALNAPAPMAPPAGQKVAWESALARAREFSGIIAFNLSPQAPPGDAETTFVIFGGVVRDVAATAGARARIVEAGGGGAAARVSVVFEGSTSAVTVALQFANRRGAALAALKGHVCHVRIEGVAVSDLSYERVTRAPSRGEDRADAERLRSVAFAALKLGAFRFESRERARLFIERTSFDPICGLVAAYALSDADWREEVEQLRQEMRRRLGVDLFDIALVARPPGEGCAPFCPITTRGWNLLRACRVALPEVLEDAQDDLEDALWTTFKPKRIAMILEAVKAGRLQ